MGGFVTKINKLYNLSQVGIARSSCRMGIRDRGNRIISGYRM